MQRFRFRDNIVVWAPAKVNLFLEVLGKRPDGYHEIATLMVAIRLFDTLILEPAPAGCLELSCQRPGLSVGADNLIIRAAKLLQERTGCSQGCRIRLVKRIPLAAGLAGGSTDAAAALLGLNDLWNLKCSLKELARFSTELGSDIPFFFHSAAAWCTGRGEVVESTPMTRPLDLVLICPPFGLSTREVYRHLKVPDKPRLGNEIRRVLAEGSIENLANALFNRLEEPAMILEKTLSVCKEAMARHAVGQLMSGSGSTLFALARSPQDAVQLSAKLRCEPALASSRIVPVRSCLTQTA